MRPHSPCSASGCPAIAVSGGRCALHAQQARRWSDARRATAAERGYDAAWRKQRAAYLKRNRECVNCGAPATDLHHITRMADGGTDDDGNLEPLCHACHSRLTAQRDGGWGRVPEARG
jgi:5-methylcytosine-specific restriction protein A